MESKLLWWPFLKQSKSKIVKIILSGLVASYCTLLLPLSLGKYMEIVFNAGGSKTRALQLLGIHLTGELYVFFIFFFSVLLVKFISSWLYSYWASLLSESFVAGLRQQLFIHYSRQPVYSNSVTRVSLLIPFGSDTKAMQHLLVKGILGLIKDSVFLLMALYVLFSLQPVLTLPIVLFIALFYWVHRWYNLAHKSLFSEKRNRQAALLNAVSQAFNNGGESPESHQKIVERKATKLQSVLVRYHRKKSLLSALTPFMLYLLVAIIMVIISWVIGPGQLQPGEIITYILLLMTLFPTIRSIIRVEHTWVMGNLAARKFASAAKQNPGNDEKASEMVKKTSNNSFTLLHSGTPGQQ